MDHFPKAFRRVVVALAAFLMLASAIPEDQMAPVPEVLVPSQGDSLRVLVLEIRDVIDPRTNRYLQLGMDKAEAEGYDIVLLDMNTYGGGVQDADEMSARLLRSTIPTYVYINENAGSAGSFISISCDSIYMSPGAVIGASTVVNQTGEVAPAKYQDFMRSKMRAAAEQTGRDPEMAAKFVGEALDTDSAKVLAMTASEAIENGFCEGQVNSLLEIFEQYGQTKVKLEVFELDMGEALIRLLINPAVKGILMLLILGGLYFELQTPGVGFPLLAALVGVVLYFLPDYLHHLLAQWEILLFVIGLALLALEIFVIPGFGVAGISGIVLIIASLFLSMIGNDGLDFGPVPSKALAAAATVTVLSFTILIGGVLLVASRIPKSKWLGRVALQDEISVDASGRPKNDPNLGRLAVTTTDLHPTGRITLDDRVWDATTQGEFIAQGESVKITEKYSGGYRVRKAPNGPSA